MFVSIGAILTEIVEKKGDFSPYEVGDCLIAFDVYPDANGWSGSCK